MHPLLGLLLMSALLVSVTSAFYNLLISEDASAAVAAWRRSRCDEKTLFPAAFLSPAFLRWQKMKRKQRRRLSAVPFNGGDKYLVVTSITTINAAHRGHAVYTWQLLFIAWKTTERELEPEQMCYVLSP